MLKLFGSALVLFASAGFAFRISADLKYHLTVLYDIRSLLYDIANEAVYSMAPMDVILLDRTHSKNADLQELCKSVGRALSRKEGADGARVWEETVASFRDRLCLGAEEAEIFAGAGMAFFGKTLEENEKCLTHYAGRLDAEIARAERERKEKQKVYRTASVMCGLIIVLLFL